MRLLGAIRETNSRSWPRLPARSLAAIAPSGEAANRAGSTSNGRVAVFRNPITFSSRSI